MSEPSKFYQQHHAIDPPAIDAQSFRPYWRLRTRLDQLLLDGAISYPEWRAARLFRALCETALAGAFRTQSLNRGDGDPLGIALAATRRIDASRRLLAIRGHLGAPAAELLEKHLVDDLSWATLGQRLGVHPKTARTWAIAAVKALAAVIWST